MNLSDNKVALSWFRLSTKTQPKNNPVLSRIAATSILAFGINLALVARSAAATGDSTWPQFRGPNCAGTSAKAQPPVNINPTNNADWKIDVPWAPSSPCVWGDRIFLTLFESGELQTRCYDAKDGKLLWSKGVKPEKLEVFHKTDGSPAAATPATDGKSVVSYFGSIGLICYDFKGKELWRHPLPVAVSGGGFGSGTSPVIIKDRVVLNRDQDENASLLAVDLASGKKKWETARPDMRGSFGTPIYWKNDGVDEIVMPGSIRLKGYDLKTGKERWMVEGVAAFDCTTPVVADDLLIFGAWSPGKSDSPFPPYESWLERNDKNKDGVLELAEFDENSRDFVRGLDRDRDGILSKQDFDVLSAAIAKGENVMVAVKPGGKGDITGTHVAWKATRGLPYVPSPLFYEGRVYLIKDGGMMSSFDAKSGQQFYLQERLDDAAGSYYASPVAADGRIYVASLPGKLTVIKAGGDKPEILHQANFGERIFATPALVGPKLYLRTQNKLYSFTNGKKT